MIRKITTRIRLTGGDGLFHDSRQDVKALSKVYQELIDKVNELTEELNKLKDKQTRT